LEREVREATWIPVFREISAAYHERRRTLPQSVAEKEQEDFIVEFTYDTNRIEGSTLTFQETSELLTRGISPDSKPMRDVQETVAHAALLRRLLQNAEPIDLPDLLRWHQAIFGETKPDISGRIRDFEVRIGGSQIFLLPPSRFDPCSSRCFAGSTDTEVSSTPSNERRRSISNSKPYTRSATGTGVSAVLP
jgi:Fic family protein